MLSLSLCRKGVVVPRCHWRESHLLPPVCCLMSDRGLIATTLGETHNIRPHSSRELQLRGLIGKDMGFKLGFE